MDDLGSDFYFPPSPLTPADPPSDLKPSPESTYKSKESPPPAGAQKMDSLGKVSVPPRDTRATLKSSLGSVYEPPKTSLSPPVLDPPLDPLAISKPSVRPIGKLSQLSLLSPELPQEPWDGFDGWRTVHEQRDFYDEQDCLGPRHGPASSKPQNRREDDVVIFDYSLDPGYLRLVDGGPPVEEGGPSSGGFGEDDDIFFQVSKDELIESEQFNQIINPAKEPQLLSRGPRLGIIDFPQCYDTYDDSLLNSMAQKLGLQREGETAFMNPYLQRVRALPGCGRFRTGVSLRAPFKKPSELARSGSSEDRFILFLSFPYFGRSSEGVSLGPESESVRLLDFKHLGVGDPAPGAVAGEEERDPIREMLVHQARYMIFDSYTMAIFRSREDMVKDQVPLHHFQERIGAFRVLIHMIANRMGLELWTLEQLQASLCKLERDINQMISDAKTYEDNQGMKGIPADEPQRGELQSGAILAEEDQQTRREDDERVRQDNVRKRKQKRVRDLHSAFNRLSAAFFAAISVAERQIAVLQDIHDVFSTSYRTKARDSEKGYPLRGNPFHRNIAPIPILSENPQQILPNTLNTIDEVVRERESFIKKVRALVENMENRRKLFFGYLKSDNAKAASSGRVLRVPPSGRTPQEEAAARKRAEETLKSTKAIQVEQAQQTQTLSGVIVVTTAFLPLSFCAEYYGMNNIKEFDEHHLSRRDFWLATGPVCAAIIILTVIIIFWKRPIAERFRGYVTKKLRVFPRNETSDIEKGWPGLRPSKDSVTAVTSSDSSRAPSLPETAELRPQ